MFIDNKYTRWYNAIVSHAQVEVNKPEVRYENHHILPHSMGGTSDPENMVMLTPRQHFICHLLLTKMTDGKDLSKMVMALNLMMNNTNKRLGRVKVTNRKYDASRFYKRVEFSEEHRRKLSEAAKRRPKSAYVRDASVYAKVSAKLKGRKKDPAHIEKYAAAQRGKKRASWGHHTEEAKQKISEIHKGRPKSDEHREKISAVQLGKKRGPYKKHDPQLQNT